MNTTFRRTWFTHAAVSCALLLAQPATAGNAYSLDDIIALALKNSAEIKAAALEEKEADARLSQAGLLPNPNLDMDVEKVKDQESHSTTDLTVALSQTIELGGKRGSRQIAAEIEVSLASLAFTARKLDFTSELTKQYIEARSCQEKLGLMQQKLELARQTLETVSRRLKLGKGSSLDEAKARALVASTELDTERLRSTLKISQERLAMAVGIEPAVIELQVVPESLLPKSSLADLEAKFANSPQVRKLRKDSEFKQKLMEVERSKQYPDLTVRGGLKYTSETKEKGFVAGITLPVPLFDRNQGNVAEATAAAQRSTQEQAAAEINLRSSLKEFYTAASTACREREILQRDVIPLVTKASSLADDAFKMGRLDYLEVLDAQRNLFEAQGQLIESSETCFKASTDIWRIVGREKDS